MLPIGLIALCACSRSPDMTPRAPPSPLIASTAVLDSPCVRSALGREALASLLNVPIVDAQPVPGDSQSCAYLTGGFPSITVSVKSGIGQSTLEAWTHGKMPFEVHPLTGVGDAALWQASLHELIARKGDLLCDVQIRAGPNDFALGVDQMPAAAAKACNQIFAAH